MTRVPNLWAVLGRSCSILFLSVFPKDFWKKIWTFLLTHFKLSIVLSKNGGYWQNVRGILAKNGPTRPGPPEIRARPLKFVKSEIYNPGYDNQAILSKNMITYPYQWFFIVITISSVKIVLSPAVIENKKIFKKIFIEKKTDMCPRYNIICDLKDFVVTLSLAHIFLKVFL